MNNNIQFPNSKLELLCEQFLQTNPTETQAGLISQLNEKLQRIVNEIQQKLKHDKLKSEDCQNIADQIDRLIIITAEQTRSQAEIATDQIAEIKEKLWTLLEDLDEYCKTHFNYTIW